MELRKPTSDLEIEATVKKAAELLQAGEVVALPTETVYGLAANALDPAAVEKIFAIKGRPSTNPVIVHVSDDAMAEACVADWPEPAVLLAEAFWPGPLTLVLPRAPHIPDIVTAGGETVGLRCPAHPLMRQVIEECGFPLAAPSANPSNQLSPTTAAHVVRLLGQWVPLVVDGGPSSIGIESTVLDLSGPRPRILRPGIIGMTAIASVIGDCAGPDDEIHPDEAQALRSPGQLPVHYAPDARLIVLEWETDAELISRIEGAGADPEEAHIIAHTHIPREWSPARMSVLPHESGAFARGLYAELHECDERKVPVVVVEAPPDAPGWEGIADRLNRAAAK